MLAVSLIFVGIALVINGVSRLFNIDAKSTAVINLMAGGVLLLCNTILLSKASVTVDYINATSGLLFGFTYVFIACNLLFKLDLRPFGWYSLFVAAYAAVMAVLSFTTKSWFYGALWVAWMILWLEGFLEIVCKAKLSKIFPWLSIAEGIFAAFIPAILILLEINFTLS